jgi:erythronate-4-phosphate dehydrogenase
VAAGEDDEDVLHRAIRQVYDITADDAALRKDPSRFDRLRADYPIRREFSNTHVQLRGASDALAQKISALGFRI